MQKPPPPHDGMLSVRQVADELGKSPTSIRTYIRDDRLDAVLIGAEYRIRREIVEDVKRHGLPPREK